MLSNKPKYTPFTIAIMGWSVYTISGTGTLLRTLLSGLKTTSELRFVVALPNSSPTPTDKSKAVFDANNYQEQWTPVTIPRPSGMAMRTWLQEAFEVFQSEADIIFYPDSITIPKKKHTTALSVTLLHDIIPLSLPEYYLNPIKYYQEKTKFNQVARYSDYIITISEYSLRMIEKKLGVAENKLHLIHNGVDEEYAGLKKPPENNKRSGVLYVGDLRRRKNVLTLIKGYLSLPRTIQQEHPLILVAEGKQKSTINKLCRAQQVTPVFHSKLNATALKTIYSQSKIMVFPSLLEGFGLPVIEAQCCGTPVICGDHSSLGEITRSTDGESAFYVNIKNPHEIKTGILALLSDEKKYHHYQNLGLKNSHRFTSAKMVTAYQNFFTQLAKEHTS